jgi:hypothetical protein
MCGTPDRVLHEMKIQESKLSRRDLWLLPCLSVLTVLLLLVGTEVTARHFFSSDERDSCTVSDANIGFSFRHNCTSRMKIAESSWVTYRYNDCGYRSGASCGRRPAGTTRIALIGSSASKGEYVEYDKTFATLAATALTSRCHRQIEVQNLGRRACSPACTFHRIDEALALQPDVLVMGVSPHDFETMLPQQVRDRYQPIPPRIGDVSEDDRAGLIARIKKSITDSRSVFAAQHFMFEDPATYLKMYLVHGDKADFLRQPFTAKWQQRFDDFDLMLGEMADKARAARVPFYLIEIPSLAQVSVLSLPGAPAKDIDATAINRELAEIAARHGVEFVDVLGNFKNTPGSNRDFFMVDGHLNADGQALVSGPLVEKLLDGNVTAFAACDLPVETASNEATVKVALK